MLGTVRVLSTKQLREATLRLFPHTGIVVESLPFIRIDIPEHIILPEAQQVDAIITSANAVSALDRIREKLPAFNTIYCISGETEALVRKLLNAVNIVARPYASELVKMLEKAVFTYPLWFFKGNKALPTIPDGLNKAGIGFMAIEVYENTAIPRVLNRDFDAVLFFSPSAVESFLKNNFIPDNTITFAIGKTTARALKPFAKQVIISETTTEASVVEAVVKYFNL